MYFLKSFFKNIGIIESLGDGIINILGLQNASNGEMIEIFLNTTLNQVNVQKALILNLGSKWVSAVCLGSDFLIKPGQFVILTNELMNIPVGDSLLGRVVSL